MSWHCILKIKWRLRISILTFFVEKKSFFPLLNRFFFIYFLQIALKKLSGFGHFSISKSQKFWLYLWKKSIKLIKWNVYKMSKHKIVTYPYCVNVNGTSMELDARRLSFAMSASLAKSVSESAKRADRRDSSRRTSSNRFFNSIGGCNGNRK